MRTVVTPQLLGYQITQLPNSRFTDLGHNRPQFSRGDAMNRLGLAAAVICLGSTLPAAQSQQDLINDGKNPNHVLTASMGYDRKNYSPLTQINKSNVKRL